MAPLTPVSDASAERLTPRSASPDTTPTETLPLAPRDVFARQAVVKIAPTPETTEESASSNSLSGGAIAGVVIGSVAGFLLLLWILKSCGLWGRPDAWGDKDPDERGPRTRSTRSGTRGPWCMRRRRGGSVPRRDRRPPSIDRVAAGRGTRFGRRWIGLSCTR